MGKVLCSNGQPSLQTQERFTQIIVLLKIKMNMGIGKGKSDKINLDGLIGVSNKESKIAQEDSEIERKIEELKDVRLTLEAAIRKMEEVAVALKTATDSADNIISGICRAIVKAEQNVVIRAKIGTDELTKVHQCTAKHIKAEEELLEKHSDKMTKHLQNNEGVWLSTPWLIFTLVVLTISYLAVILWAIYKR